MITKLTIKTKAGKESTWTKEEAKELYNALHELFGTKEIIVERYKDYYRPPYYPWVTYTTSLSGSADTSTKLYNGNAVSLTASTDEKASY